MIANLTEIKLGKPIEWLFPVLLFFGISCFLVVKSALTAVSLVLFFSAIFLIARSPERYLRERAWDTWLIFALLLVPFLAELSVQLARGNFQFSSIDGSSRWLIFAVLFLVFSKRCDSRIVDSIVYGSGLGVVLALLSILAFPEQFPGRQRVETYFVDSITLPCYMSAMTAIFLLGFRCHSAKFVSVIAKIIIVCCTVYVAIESRSRSSWISIVAVLVLYLGVLVTRDKRIRVLNIICLMLGVLILYAVSDTVKLRVNRGVDGFMSFLDSSYSLEAEASVQNSSVGQRLVLWQIDMELIERHFFLGVSDAELPPYEDLAEEVKFLNQEIYNIREVAGSHSEFTAILVRQGLFFGTLSILSIFVVPLCVGLSRIRRANSSEAVFAKSILLALFSIAVSGIGIQVLNLKMTVTFYGVCLVALLSICSCLKVSRGDKKV